MTCKLLIFSDFLQIRVHEFLYVQVPLCTLAMSDMILCVGSGKTINCHCVIVTTGTFLRGEIHIGKCNVLLL